VFNSGSTEFDSFVLGQCLRRADPAGFELLGIHAFLAAPTTAVVDLGYRGVDRDNPGLTIIHRGKAKSLGEPERKLIKRRNAVERKRSMNPTLFRV